jgi:hypothetical protein
MAKTITEDRIRRERRRAAESWSSDLDKYRHDAAGILDTHQSRLGWCNVCGKAWPCERVLAAEGVVPSPTAEREESPR